MESNDMNDVQQTVMEPEASGPSKTARNWAMGCHLAGLCGVAVPFPAAGLIATLILWLLKREDAPYIDRQGKEALNFQISLLIYVFISALLVTIGIGVLLLFAVILFGFICIVLAAIKASEGADYRYPACLRLVK